MEDSDEETKLQCPVCSQQLKEPYVRCLSCPNPLLLCLNCFARGTEVGEHQNNHSYNFVRDDIPLFESSWTAAEELKLLSLISEFGFGNWSDIAQQLKTKSKQECERHYLNCFVENPNKQLPSFPEFNQAYYPSPVAFKLSDDPPRPQDGSPLFLEMGGYSAAAGDFNVEYNNFIELELKDMTFDTDDNNEQENKEEGEQETDEDDIEDAEKEDHNFLTELKLAVIHIYRECIKERWRRKKIIRDYGLINIRKITSFNRHYDRIVRHTVSALNVFNRLLPPTEFDLYIESLHYGEELRNEIRKLQEYRENGLRLRHQIKNFNQLKSRRDLEKQEHHLLSEVLSNIQNDAACKTFLQRQAVLEHISKGQNVALPTAPRRSAPPLEITGLPGYDKLLPKEKELCAVVRLVPDAYLEFKRLLQQESQKFEGSLKLAQARTLIKIDVNKTRKLYDFLVQENIIKKAPP
ncbi:transcriptional adapter 2-alpha [Octopus sinensis]|uniref:Transcriptional adapter n=1 Tax=Octopus sinensis TaxID=2607531 RepID=A0A6P7TM79_9MOLL|nr:transcriptional adapter 2-alpha [Octopus sinensis]